jgi:hypothetical protein
MTKENEYKTSDLALSAYLSLKRFAIIRIETNPIDAKRKWFVFLGKNIEKEINKFTSRGAKVDPREYFNELKTIKQRLYNQF